MKYVLVWAVMTVGAQGPVQGTLPETTKFESAEACEQFGAAMTPRLQDWMRGAVRSEWDHPVQVAYACQPDGRPA